MIPKHVGVCQSDAFIVEVERPKNDRIYYSGESGLSRESDVLSDEHLVRVYLEPIESRAKFAKPVALDQLLLLCV